MFRFHRTAALGRAALEPSNKFFVQVSDDQLCHAINDRITLLFAHPENYSFPLHHDIFPAGRRGKS